MQRSAAVAILLVVFQPSLGRTACRPGGLDATDVALARAAIAAACDCAGAASHRAYVRCAREAAKAVLARQACVGAVLRCASRSTCGRPGAVTCCRTSAGGVTSGSLRSAASACTPRRGRRACVGASGSLCDACASDGCAAITTTSTSTSTTLPPSVCGNGVVEAPGEQCDGQIFCGSDCAIHVGVCCLFGGACAAASVIVGSSELRAARACFFQSGSFALGACVPGPTPGCPPPGGLQPPLQCGTCQPASSFVPTSICCQRADGSCGGATVADEAALSGACNLPPFGTDDIVVGTCGADGRCVPG